MMRNLVLVLVFAALLAATGQAAAQRTIVSDPPGAAFQDQAYREMNGLEQRRMPAPRANLSDRGPARKQITRRKHSN
jgi:hypothetical protein